jgi:hypothetical protein
LFSINNLIPQQGTDGCSNQVEIVEDSLRVDVIGECGSLMDGYATSIISCYFSAIDECGNKSAVYTTQLILIDPEELLTCPISESAPVKLRSATPSINGMVDRVLLKFFKEQNPIVKYQPEDNAACEIKFLPIKDLSTNTWIVDADTSFIGTDQVRNPGQELFQYPLMFFRPDILPNTLYGWTIRCYCEDGAGAASPWASPRLFRTPDFNPLTGVFNPGSAGLVMGDSESDNPDNKLLSEKLDLEVSVYPNPADDVVNIRISGLDETNYHFMLTDMLGNVIESNDILTSIKSDAYVLNSSNLPSGSYVIQISTNGYVSRQLLIISR